MSTAFFHRMPNGDLHVYLALDLAQPFTEVKIETCDGSCGYQAAKPTGSRRPAAAPAKTLPVATGSAGEAVIHVTVTDGKTTTVLTGPDGAVLWERKEDWHPTVGKALAGVYAKKHGYSLVLAAENSPKPHDTPAADPTPTPPTPTAKQGKSAAKKATPPAPAPKPATVRVKGNKPGKVTKILPAPAPAVPPPSAPIPDDAATSADPFVQDVAQAKTDKTQGAPAKKKRRYLSNLDTAGLFRIAKSQWGLTDAQAESMNAEQVVEFIIQQEFAASTATGSVDGSGK